MILLSSSAWGFGFFTNWCSTPLFAQDLQFFWKMILLSSSVRDSKLISDTSILFHLRFWIFHKLRLCPSVRERFRVFLKNDTSILFRSRFEADLWFTDTSILLRSRFEADLGLLILLSSSARGSKLILIYWYFYPPPLEVRSWSLTVTCSLYWTYTWRPAKFGSVLVLHLKANQTCSLNFTICLLT